MSTLNEEISRTIVFDPTKIGRLVLQIGRSSSAERRTVKIAGTRCSIGSSSNCNLRLLAAGIEPLHCSILRGPGRAYLQRWAGDLRVNGQSVSEADLKTGDEIQLGELTLQIESDGTEMDFEGGTENNRARITCDLRANETSTSESEQKIQQLLSDLRDAKSSLESAELREKESDQRCQSLRQALAIAEQSANNFRSQVEALVQSADKMRQRIAELEQRLCSLQASSNIATSDASSSDAGSSDASSSDASSTNSQLVAIGLQSSEPAETGAAVERDEDVLARLRAAGILRDDPLVSRPAEICQLESVAVPVAEEPVAADDAATDEPEFEINKESSTESNIDESPKLVPAVENAANPGVTANQSLGTAAPRAESSRDDDSIEDYMAKLMARVRGESGPVARVAAAPKNNEPTQPSATKQPPETPASPSRNSVETRLTRNTLSYSQRAIPGDYQSNLAVMREISMSSARTAIATHDLRGWLQTATGKWIGSLIALLTSLGISYFGGKSQLMIGIAAAGFSTAVYWAFQGIVLARRAQSGSKTNFDPSKAVSRNDAVLSKENTAELDAAVSATSKPAGEVSFDVDFGNDSSSTPA